ncbi:hypothetical protein [Synechocystis sp. LKSZ1]|uniref:hypothetical protein n=1 Tax=Synechocystis sp. LKSZ1 TaxID=3144951 RepID=UPI00336C177A
MSALTLLRNLFPLGLLVFVVPPSAAQTSGPAFRLNPADLAVQMQPRAKPEAQRQHRQKQADLIYPQAFDLTRHPVTEAEEGHWRKTLWATALLEPQDTYVVTALDQILALTERSDLSPSQARTVQTALQVATQLFLANPSPNTPLGQRFLRVVDTSPTAEWSVMALSALVQGGLDPDLAQAKQQALQARFQGQENVALAVALQDITAQLQPPAEPPLADLLNWQIAPGQTHLYLFCRRDRSVLCRAILKDAQGQWVRDNSQPGRPLWSVPLLTRSLHGLRWNFIRGATPQGIYRMEGLMPRSEPAYFGAYGQFPLVKVFLPLESGVQAFRPGQGGTFPKTLTEYQTLLPSSWRDYFPIQQSYWAGRLGRSLIRIHGSGELPDFFANNRRFPDSYGWNPAIGCVSALELYNPDGTLQRADMPQILQALAQSNQGRIEGYLIVSEIGGNQQKPVSLAELEAALAP